MWSFASWRKRCYVSLHRMLHWLHTLQLHDFYNTQREQSQQITVSPNAGYDNTGEPSVGTTDTPTNADNPLNDARNCL